MLDIKFLTILLLMMTSRLTFVRGIKCHDRVEGRDNWPDDTEADRQWKSNDLNKAQQAVKKCISEETLCAKMRCEFDHRGSVIVQRCARSNATLDAMRDTHCNETNGTAGACALMQRMARACRMQYCSDDECNAAEILHDGVRAALVFGGIVLGLALMAVLVVIGANIWAKLMKK